MIKKYSRKQLENEYINLLYLLDEKEKEIKRLSHVPIKGNLQQLYDKIKN